MTFSEQFGAVLFVNGNGDPRLAGAEAERTVDIPGLTAGPVDLGRAATTAVGNDATWSATVNRSGAAVTVTLTGAQVGAGCANLSSGPSALTTFKASSVPRIPPHSRALDVVTVQWF
jgi:hypothetical protein